MTTTKMIPKFTNEFTKFVSGDDPSKLSDEQRMNKKAVIKKQGGGLPGGFRGFFWGGGIGHIWGSTLLKIIICIKTG